MGASGFLGRNISPFLARAGIDVIGLVRSGKIPSVRDSEIEFVEFDRDTDLSRILRRVDCVIHTIGISRQSPTESFLDVNLGMTKRILQACVKANVGRIVYFSGLGVSSKSTDSYFGSKYLAEEAIRASGLTYTLLRPSYIIGSGDELTLGLVRQIEGGEVVVIGSGKYRFQPIYVEDVSKLVLAILKSSKGDNLPIDVVGREKISYLKYVHLLSKLVGRRPKLRFISLETSYQRALRNPDNWLSVDELNVLVGDFVSSFRPLQQMFGLVPRTIDAALKEILSRRQQLVAE
jgi:nucleoside-diphosphate-sugar epimerase